MTIEEIKDQFTQDIRTKAYALDAINQLLKANEDLVKQKAILENKLSELNNIKE